MDISTYQWVMLSLEVTNLYENTKKMKRFEYVKCLVEILANPAAQQVFGVVAGEWPISSNFYSSN